jgi:peptidoglycan/LPS O-acetylase OafA/YrhL
MVHHAWPRQIGTGGIVGVVVFFTLSGYLITGLLAADIRTHGRVRYGRFYRNRALRLLPALVFLLGGFTAVTLSWDPLGDRQSILRSLVVGMTYTADIPFDHGSGALSPLWTLATEEQFYLVWPLVLALAVRSNRVRPALIISALVVVVLLVASMVVARPEISRVYPLPTSWCIAMIIGAAGYFALEKVPGWLARSRASGAMAGGALLVLLILMWLPEAKDSPYTYLVLGPVIAWCGLAIIRYVQNWQMLPSRVLWPLRGLGQISYSAYLWNYAITMWFGATTAASPIGGLLTICATLALAGLSWFAVERPALRMKTFLDGRSDPAARTI